jgi:hypothetical protein
MGGQYSYKKKTPEFEPPSTTTTTTYKLNANNFAVIFQTGKTSKTIAYFL